MKREREGKGWEGNEKEGERRGEGVFMRNKICSLHEIT